MSARYCRSQSFCKNTGDFTRWHCSSEQIPLSLVAPTGLQGRKLIRVFYSFRRRGKSKSIGESQNSANYSGAFAILAQAIDKAAIDLDPVKMQ
jgi:hypothetical protein